MILKSSYVGHAILFTLTYVSSTDNLIACLLSASETTKVAIGWNNNIPFFFIFLSPSLSLSFSTTFERISRTLCLSWREKKTKIPPLSIHWIGREIVTGEYILNSGNQEENGNNAIEEDDRLLREASLDLDNHPLAGLTDDSLGLTDTLELENDLPSDLLGGSLLASANVESLLNNDSLDLPDGFNLEEALQLVGLDEAQSEVCPDLYLPTFYSFLSATFVYIFFFLPIVERTLKKKN